MNNLYNNLAAVYDAMYKTFINYEEEFYLYHQLLKKYNCNSLVEIGCGTGNLAQRFVESGFEYTGLDISDDMLTIAKNNNPAICFLKSGMQDFVLAQKISSAIITGRTISYLLTNEEVTNTLTAIFDNLKDPGIVCFDFIDANRFIPQTGKGKVTHRATVEQKKFCRESFWTPNLIQCWAFDWLSVFYEEQADGSLAKIGEDNSTIRAFTRDDITLFLQLAGFSIKEIIERKTYAFDTFVVIAQKIN